MAGESPSGAGTTEAWQSAVDGVARWAVSVGVERSVISGSTVFSVNTEVFFNVFSLESDGTGSGFKDLSDLWRFTIED